MEKWVRRTLHATVSAGVVALCTTNLANADETTIVTPDVKSESAAVLGDNSILGGNSLSAPIVAPVTGNDVAVAGIGGAVNAEDVLAVLGIVGKAHADSCGSDETTVVAPKVRSSSSSVAGDNSIGSANNASVPVVAPITDNKVAVAGIGAAVNGEDVSVIGGVVGEASCGGDGSDGDGPYLTAEDGGYKTEALPVGAVSGLLPSGAGQVLGTATGLADSLPVAPTGVVDNVMSMVGLASLDGLTNLAGLGGLGGATDVVGTVADTATSTASSPRTAELNENTELATETAELNSSDPVATTHAAGGDETTVVAPKVKSSSASAVGDNSIGSGNSLSLPVSIPVTGNDVSVAGIGAAVNADEVTGVLGVLGTATALLD